MPYLNSIPQSSRSREMTARFGGYCHTLSAANGQLYEGCNLSAASYPLLSTRAPRGVLSSFTAFGGMLGGERLAYVDNGVLYYGGLPTALTGLSSGEKQLVSMGAYICIFPDKKYYNTEDAADYGSMEARWMSPGLSATITYRPCLSNGTPLTDCVVSASAPTSPSHGDIWINSSDSSRYEYSELTMEWTAVSAVYTRLDFSTYGQLGAFKELDGVTVTGARYDELNGSKIIYALGGDAGGNLADYIVLAGGTPGEYTDPAGHIEISRSLPALDYVVECQNRLWGCYYGLGANGPLNELYCSALGDFKNWSQYLGASTDSWTASVGSGGEWTGAVNYLGYPTFFKENCIHKVIVSPTGAHQLTHSPCRGVQKGSAKSLCIAGETLYYKSPRDICAWQGGFPVTVSEALGEQDFSSAVAGCAGKYYYISMSCPGGGSRLFVYDTAQGLWMPEDNLKVRSFARADGELYAAAELTQDGGAEPSGNAAGAGSSPSATVWLLALTGGAGTAEAGFAWSAESGLQTFNRPDKKYVSRFDLRLQLEPGAACQIYLEYDSSGLWVPSGQVSVGSRGSCMVPVRPRRCDHFRIKLAGSGAMKLFSLTYYLEDSSDD